MKKIISIALTIALFTGVLTACSAVPAAAPAASGTAASEAPKQVKAIELLGSSGTSYQVAVGVADIISNAGIGYKMSATGTANTAANMIEMRDKDPSQTIYMGSMAAFVSQREGNSAFKDLGPDDRGRMIMAFAFGNNGLATLNPDIKSIEDLDGKSVGWDAEAIHTTHFRQVCEDLGINVDIKCLGFTDKYEALKDGLVDAVYGNFTGASDTVMVPVTFLQEIMLSDQVYPISFPKDIQEKAVSEMEDGEAWPYTPTVAAEGTIEGQPSFELYGSASVTLCAFADSDEDMIYDFTKVLCENCEQLGNFDPSCKGLTPELLVSQLGDLDESQIHPGALKYYKEVGLWK